MATRKSNMTSNILKNPSFVPSSDCRLDTFSLRRSSMLLLSKDSLGYDGDVRRLTAVVAQQILEGNKEQMKFFPDSGEPQ